MTALERRALMGDAEAQRECTEKGITLPCPCCGGKPDVFFTGLRHTFGPQRFRVMCTSCLVGTWWSRYRHGALTDWNTRPAPPIGRCFECKHLGERTVHETGGKENFCNHDQYGLFALDSTNAYCSYFEPKVRSEQ